MKVFIIANPVAGGGRAYRRIRRYVEKRRSAGLDIEILTTRSRGHAGVLAADLIAESPDLLAVCGGDGTVHEVATAVPSPPFPVAVLPAGTANVIARELRLPLDPVEALQVALRRTVKRVDLGVLGPGAGRCFLFAAGVGFDAYTASRVPSALKARFGMAAYFPVILACLRSYAFPEFQVQLGGRTFTATSCVVSNTRSYGGGLLLSPDADMSDGVLDVLVLEGRRRLELARFLLLAWCGKAEKRGWVHRLRSARLKMDGPADIPVQADGEQAGGLPLDIRLMPAAYPLVVPP